MDRALAYSSSRSYSILLCIISRRAYLAAIRSYAPTLVFITFYFLIFVVSRSWLVCIVTFLWTVFRIGSMTSYRSHSDYLARSVCVSSINASVKLRVIMSIRWRGTGGMLRYPRTVLYMSFKATLIVLSLLYLFLLESSLFVLLIASEVAKESYLASGFLILCSISSKSGLAPYLPTLYFRFLGLSPLKLVSRSAKQLLYCASFSLGVIGLAVGSTLEIVLPFLRRGLSYS